MLHQNRILRKTKPVFISGKKSTETKEQYDLRMLELDCERKLKAFYDHQHKETLASLEAEYEKLWQDPS